MWFWKLTNKEREELNWLKKERRQTIKLLRDTNQKMLLMMYPETRDLVIDDTNARYHLPVVDSEPQEH